MIFKDYMDYLKDNLHGYWFKAKLYGWGWTPATWQGWLVLFIFVTLIVLNAFRIDATSHSVNDTLINFVPETVVLVFLLLFICLKRGEKPHWQWGPPKQNGGNRKKISSV